MEDLANVGDAGGEADIIALQTPEPAEDGGELSVHDAVQAITEARRKAEEQGNPESADDATGEPQESADEADAGEPEAPPSETQEADAAPEAPPIEPPRSWTSEDKELFKNLPRETQERLAERERSRELDFNRRQQEATEQRKAAEAERQRVEQARAQYESALPALLQTLQDQQAGQFADIKTVDDATRLATEDPFRFAQFQAHQMRLAAVQQEINAAQQRQSQEKATKWQEFLQRQNELAKEKIPELADSTKAAQLMSSAVEVLHDKGFTDKELAELASGQKDISLQDHRMQLLIYDAIRYRDAQKAVQAVKTAKPVPPVQRPGVAHARATAEDAKIQELEKRLERTGDARVAAELLIARRAAAATRRSA